MTNAATETIVEYLREAHAAEKASLSLLQADLRGTPPGRYRTAVRDHVGETRRHVRQVEERLTELNANNDLLAMGLSLVEGALGRVAGAALAPLNALVSRTAADTDLRNAQDLVASEAREVAAYKALEEIASRAGDKTTAALARSLRSDEERMLEALDGALDGLVGRLLRERAGIEVREEAPVSPPEPASAPRKPAAARKKPATRKKPVAKKPPAPRRRKAPARTTPDGPGKAQAAALRQAQREAETTADSPGPEIHIDERVLSLTDG